MCRVLVANAPVHSGREPVPDPELDIVWGGADGRRDPRVGMEEEKKKKKEKEQKKRAE